jgi:polyhydroxyalkanoate synthesis regulator phasin
MSARPPLPADLWDSLPSEARALSLAQRAEVAELQARVQALQQQVQELEAAAHYYWTATLKLTG